MFVPRAVSLRLGKSDCPAMKMAKADDQVATLLVAYLRKRKLSKTLKSFLAETSFKDTGVALEEDLETICGHYFTKSAIPEKRKTHSGVLGSVVKRAKISELEDKIAGNSVRKTPTLALALVSAKKGGVSLSNAEPTRHGIAAQDTSSSGSSSSDGSDTGRGKRQSLEAAVVVAARANNGASKGVTVTTANSESSSSGSDSEDNAKASSESSSSDEIEHDKKLAPKNLPGKQMLGHNPRADSSSSESSDQSSGEDSTIPAAKLPGKNSSQIANGGTPVAPASADQSSSDDSSSEEVEEKVEVSIPVVGTPAPSRKSERQCHRSGDQLPSKGGQKSVTKLPPPLSEDPDSDSGSSSDEEPERTRAQHKITGKMPGQKQRSVAASLKPVARNAGELAPNGGKPECQSSSSDSDASSAEETQPVKMVQKPVIKKPGAASSSGKTPGESSSSDDSDSSSAEETQPVKVVQKPVSKKAHVAPSGAKTQGESSSSDNSDDSSEEDTKPVKVVQTPVMKKAGVAPSGDKTQVNSPSDDSDSSSAEDTEPLKVIQQPVTRKTQMASVGAKFQGASSSSDDSDSSSKEDTKPVRVVQGPAVKMAEVPPNGDRARLSSPSDDSDSSSEEDTKPPKVIQHPVIRKTQMASVGAKSQLASSSSDDSGSSSEEDAEAVKQVQLPVNKKLEQNKPVQNAESSSDSDSSSDEEPKVASLSQKTVAISTASAKQSVKTDMRMDTVEIEEVKVKITEKGAKSTVTPNLTSVLMSETRKRSIGDGLAPGKNSEASAGNGSDYQNALTTDSTDNKSKRRKSSQAPEKEAGTKFFQKIDVKEVTYADPKLQDNSYWAKNGAEEGWGAKAQMTLQNVKGKGFRHEKTKKKRGSYKGGVIDFASHSIKFQNSDEE